ncbi:DUF4304 domain-containing protein [Schumannella luteola]
MAQIVAAHAKSLRDLGFRKRRHGFNRLLDSGLVHVVRFWQAPKEPPAWTEVPGLRERLYGKFRLDFGVYVPQMDRTHMPRSEWINEYDCSIHASIGQLVTGEWKDLWWDLGRADAEAVAGEALSVYGIPWLESFPDQESVIDAYRRGGTRALWGHPATPLDVATLLANLGRGDEARVVVESYVAAPVGTGHADYLRGWLDRSGYADLVPLVSTPEPKSRVVP